MEWDEIGVDHVRRVMGLWRVRNGTLDGWVAMEKLGLLRHVVTAGFLRQ